MFILHAISRMHHVEGRNYTLGKHDWDGVGRIPTVIRESVSWLDQLGPLCCRQI